LCASLFGQLIALLLIKSLQFISTSQWPSRMLLRFNGGIFSLNATYGYELTNHSMCCGSNHTLSNINYHYPLLPQNLFNPILSPKLISHLPVFKWVNELRTFVRFLGQNAGRQARDRKPSPARRCSALVKDFLYLAFYGK
jgi:hypothetical protein